MIFSKYDISIKASQDSPSSNLRGKGQLINLNFGCVHDIYINLIIN